MIDYKYSSCTTWRFYYSLLIVLIGHFPQYRKNSKVGIDGISRLPHYYGHIFRVCGLVIEWAGSPDAILVALLHDVLEDTTIPKWLLLPLGKRVLHKIEILTQNPLLPKPLRKMEYCSGLVASQDLDVFLVAICDKWDNWKCYEMEGDIPQSVIEYYSCFITTLGNYCQHPLLMVLKEEVDKKSLYCIKSTP